jgi:universal stress protein E
MPKILVIIDPEETNHSALNRIKEIPATADVDYKVDLYVDAVPVLASNAGSVDIHTGEKKKWLDELVAPLRDVGYRITTEVIAFTRLYEEMIRSAQKFGADLVFKPLRQHNTLRRVFFTSTDWNLIRLCPMPVLMVSDEVSVRGKPIVAGVDVGDDDAAHKELNNIVLEQAKVLAGVLESEIHVVYAYGPAVVASRAAVADPLAYQIARDKYDEELDEARGLARTHEVSDSEVHLREGAADAVLAEYAEEVGAAAIVLGTVSRKGAAGLFIGNTAEAALERTPCDMFVVKLSDFQTPTRG